MADQIEAEGEYGCGDAGATAGDHRSLRIDARRGEFGAKLVDREESPVRAQQLRIGKVQRARDMSGAAAGPELGLGRVEAAGTAGIQHLFPLAPEIVEKLLFR